MKKTSVILLLLSFNIISLYARASSDWSILIDNFGGKTEHLAARCIAQDDDGMIWFGTNKSLFSYDGYNLKSYLNDEGHIQFNAICTNNHKVFIGCNNGLYVYDIYTEEFRKIEYFDKDRIKSLIVVDDCLYIGAMSGLYRYKLVVPESSSTISKFSSDMVLSLTKDNENLLVGTAVGAYVFDLKENTLTNLGLEDKGIVSHICRRDSTSLLTGSPNSLTLYDSHSGNKIWSRHYSVVSSIDVDAEGQLLIGTDNGLYLSGNEEGTDERLSESPVWSSLMDKDGNIWFATDNGILFCKTGCKIRPVILEDIPSYTLFTDIYKDKNNRIWATSNQGIFQLENTDAGLYELVRKFDVDSKPYHIPHNRIKKIVQSDYDGSIYVASDAGYFEYDEPSNVFVRNKIPNTNNWFYDILTEDQKVWFATFDGVFCISGGNVDLQITTKDGLSSNDVAQIVKGCSNTLWILTRDQTLYIYDYDSHELSQVMTDEYADGEHVDYIFSSIDGVVWVATNKGLLSFDGVADGCPERHFAFVSKLSVETYSMNEIFGTIWVCTSEGVFTYDVSSGQVGRINSGDIYSCVYHDLQNGNILLASLGNLSYFPVSEMDELFNKDNQRICITSVTINGKDAVPVKEIDSGRITLKGGRDLIKISFSDFDYSGDIPNTYYFSMVRRKAVWNEAIPGNDLVLSELTPGNYTLSISPVPGAANSSGAVLDVHVSRPWYLSFPMLALYLAVLSLLVGWIIHYLAIKKYLVLERNQRDILLEQYKQKEAFFGNIAHEFKTPLSLIIAPLSKLLKDTKDADAQSMLKIVQENANKLNSLVHHTIDYYNENNRTPDDLIKTEVEFVEFARTIFFSYKDNYPKDEFIFDSSSKEILVDADVVKMETVLNNLMSNACKYTPEGGSVIMTLERDNTNNMLIMKVSDTGIGIPEDEIPLVFNRYFESSRTKNGNYDSTGIGLSVMKQIITNHGGTVSVSSDDNGTTFTVIVPCLEGRATAEKADEQVSAEEDSKPLVVIVDDNAQICNFLETVLRNKYRCISSNNGKSGLKLCVDVMPDLIISDVMMPVMDGLEMCSQIRKYNLLSTIPIILLTAKGDKETEKKSIDLNIDSFVPKPFDLPTLLARIEQLIGNKQRMEQKLRIEMMSKPAEVHDLSYHEQFLKKVTSLIEDHIDDSDLSVTSLCALGGFSEKQLYRAVKQMTGLSTVEYIRSIRMKKAAILLQNGNFTISEVMYSVGFTNPSYFTRIFSSLFGKTPSEYMKSYKES